MKFKFNYANKDNCFRTLMCESFRKDFRRVTSKFQY